MAQAPLYAFPEAFSIANTRTVCKDGLATSSIKAVKSLIAESGHSHHTAGAFGMCTLRRILVTSRNARERS